MGNLYHSLNIRHIHHRIGWCLYVNCFCILCYISFYFFFVAVHAGKSDIIFF